MPSKIIFPLRGASNAAAYIDQPGDTAPVESLLNVRSYSSSKDRPRGGQRPALVKSFGFDFGGEFQAMEVVSRASFVSGYQETNCTDIGGVTHLATALRGQVWWLKPNLSMFKDIYDDGTLLGGSGTEAVPCIAVSAIQPRMAYAYTVNSGPNTIVRVVAYNPSDGAFIWAQTIVEAGVNRFVNTIAFGREFLFVTTNSSVFVYHAMTGQPLYFRELGAGGDELAKETVGARAWVDPLTDAEYLFVLFNGIDTGGTLPNSGETIQSGDAASMFRSGVAKFFVASLAAIAPGTLDYVQYGTPLAIADPWWESDHKTFRVSERTLYRPHGCWVNALAIGADGSVYVGRTNQGWGPNTIGYNVNGQVGYVTVFKVNNQGEMAWESDTDSIKEAGYHGGNNDIPNGAGDDPSILAVAADAAGNVYAAGRRNEILAASGANVFYLNGASGDEFWRQNLSGTIRQAAACIDPTDDNCWFGGDRNSDWTGAAGANAHLWKTAQFGGAVLRYYDLNEAVSALGVCVDAQAGREGRIYYSTDYVS